MDATYVPKAVTDSDDEDVTVPPPAFDPYRIAATPAMRELVNEVTSYMLRTEEHLKLRQRARRPADLKIFRATVEALVCDLAYQHLTGHASIRVTRNRENLSRASRYTSELLSKQLPEILDLMHKRMGLIFMELGVNSPFESKQTEISPQTWLVTRFEQRGLTIYDTDRREGEELILLKGTKVSQSRADLAEYLDDEFTSRARAEVQHINSYLRSADINYDLDISSTGHLVDGRRRYLRRVFTRSNFCSGGRLFGGFWQSLGKSERLANTTINGEPVVSLDYSSMLARLAYALVRETPPLDDAYITTFQVKDDQEPLTLKRSTVKKLFAASLFAEKPLKQWPDRLQPAGRGLPVSVVLAGIKRAHPALVPLMYQGIGHRLQFTESEILIDALLQLIAKDIPALPVHDCLVVPESGLETVREIMETTFMYQTGATARVAIERASD